MSRKRTHITSKSDPSLIAIAKKLEDATPEKVLHHHFDGGSSHEHKEVLKIRTQQIAIGIPMDELMFSQFLVNLLGLHLMPWDMLITTTSTYLPMARNQIHNIFIKNKDQGTHLLMLDSDVLPSPHLITNLLTHEKDMVGGYYYKKEKYGVKDLDGNIQKIQRPVVYDFDKEKNGYVQRIAAGTGLEEIAGAGAGCWLMSRKLAEDLGESPYGQDLGEDLVICEKIEKLGYKMFVDWNMKCGHIGAFFV